MYEPEEMKKAYEKVEHGEAKIAAIRSAIEAADREGDIPFQIFFRMDLCKESEFYGNSLDEMIVFPEIMSLVDRYPDADITSFDAGIYRDNTDHMLWIYKWILSTCTDYYQIPMEDCLRFYEDYKTRLTAYGYNLKTYYKSKSGFYEYIDQAVSEEAFRQFERIPRDGNSDCKACDRNAVIKFYLDKDDLPKADALARDIENFTLTCRERMDAWLRLKKHYMEYHMDHKEFEKAVAYSRLIKRHLGQKTEYDCWDEVLYCYAHVDIGKALQLYKQHWKEWEKDMSPYGFFDTSKYICCFFLRLGEHLKDGTVKLSLDESFPLYREDGKYRIEALYQYYYDRARNIAEKFDARNGTDHFCKDLEEIVQYEKELSLS